MNLREKTTEWHAVNFLRRWLIQLASCCRGRSAEPWRVAATPLASSGRHQTTRRDTTTCCSKRQALVRKPTKITLRNVKLLPFATSGNFNKVSRLSEPPSGRFNRESPYAFILAESYEMSQGGRIATQKANSLIWIKKNRERAIPTRGIRLHLSAGFRLFFY